MAYGTYVHMYMCTLYFPYIRTYVCMYGIWYIYKLCTDTLYCSSDTVNIILILHRCTIRALQSFSCAQCNLPCREKLLIIQVL